MTGIKIKPVSGYGDALKDCNQVPVLTLADRVRRDILLPVLDRRPDSVLDRSNAKFMRSENGSALIHRNHANGLQLLQEMDHTVTAGYPSKIPFDNPGKYIGFDFYAESEPGMPLYVKSYDDISFFDLFLVDPVYWLHTTCTKFQYVAHGSKWDTIDVRVYQFG